MKYISQFDSSDVLDFEAKALKSTEKIIDHNTPVPFIAHLEKSDESNHFVVIYKVKKGKLWIADPNLIRKKHVQTKEEFDKEWSGDAIFLTLTPEFKPTKETSGKLRRYLPLLKPHVGTLLKAVFASVILIILGIMGAFYFSYLINEVILSKSEFSLQVLSLGLVLLIFFKVGLGRGRGFFGKLPHCYVSGSRKSVFFSRNA